MAHAYTPGLKVSSRMTVRKERRLPLEGDVLPAVGARLVADEVVARTELPGRVYPVNVANVLGVSPERLAESMTCQAGDAVEEGQVVAETAGFFGFFGSEARAPVAGTIESISSITGQVLFQAHPIPVEIDAYVDGEVVERIEGEGVVLESEAALVQGIFGLGGEVRGPVHVLSGAPDEELGPERFDPELRGKVVICGSFLSLQALEAARGAGVAGLVVGGFDYDDIKSLLGYEVGVAITGSEDFGLTLVVTEGFGRIPMAAATWKLLKGLEGLRASINGATQIRAGVIRPEVVVPLSASDEADIPRSDAEGRPTQVGDRIRGIRAPYFGSIGTVRDLPSELEKMASETMVRVMVVEWEDGSTGRIPRSNVELIEGD